MICDPAILDHDIDGPPDRDESRNEDFPERRYGHRCRRCGMMEWSQWEPVTADDLRADRDEQRMAASREDR